MITLIISIFGAIFIALLIYISNRIKKYVNKISKDIAEKGNSYPVSRLPTSNKEKLKNDCINIKQVKNYFYIDIEKINNILSIFEEKVKTHYSEEKSETTMKEFEGSVGTGIIGVKGKHIGNDSKKYKIEGQYHTTNYLICEPAREINPDCIDDHFAPKK